ncbi:HD domain-containing protein [Amycolatopsis magusensis]|uniref:HD domain-containing protein n=1 Tax=Amycolatopsis magusensis TaxID=882444 RepID=UPI003F686FE5
MGEATGGLAARGGQGARDLRLNAREAWLQALVTLGGDLEVGARAAAELAAQYAQPHRRYHTTAHLEAVVRDSAELGAELGLNARDKALVALAACAHDVVYDARPGHDERHSADWAVSWLEAAGLAAADVLRVEELVLTTLGHDAPAEDLAASALLDADLATLGGSAASYDEYARNVRAEYAAVSEPDWRSGRAKVLARLLARDPLYRTGPARLRWESAAKRNLARELAGLEPPG